ncbi:MAG: SGNH/GDSL hydrolase family protein [Sphingomonadaceae bacterium]
MSADLIARGMAAAQSRSAETQALARAIRTNGFFPQPSYRCPANDVATITVPAAEAPSAINGNLVWVNQIPITDTGRFTFLAGTADRKPANIVWQPRGAWYSGSRQFAYFSVEFNHTGTSFEWQMVCGMMIPGVTNFRVLVDGRVSASAAVPVDGGSRYIRITFPTAATRRIRIETSGGYHRGANAASPTEITGTGRTYPLVTLIGDSFPEGTGQPQNWDGEGISMLRMLGMNPANASVGGTGLLNPGTGGKVNWQHAERLADLALNGWTDQITGAAPGPAMGVVMMSVNDSGLGSSYWPGSSSLQEGVNKALWVLIDHWAAQRPGKPLVVFGPTFPNSTPPLDIYRIRDGGQEACAGAAGANVWFIDRLAPGPILRGGVYSNAADQASLYTMGATDPTHPNPAGHTLDALWMARQVRGLVLGEMT